ncbi:hypothetical protein [Bacillus marinisedimentorum]|uniref:hypothetical protein n=1 Tax=Bacillus marinisedimentorum TaxID=1821260 RepID=UPI0007E1CAE9|nr:hypothetical protein [Bacillus marinisedimentorum]
MISSFYVIKPRMTRGDLFYKVYVTDTSLLFIKLGGQFHNRDAFENQVPGIAQLLFLFGFNKVEKRQSQMEKSYDESIQQNQVFELLRIKENFSINHRDIQEILVNKKGTLHTGFHDNGTIIIKLKSDKDLKFIIPKTTLRREIHKALHEVQPPLPVKEL